MTTIQRFTPDYKMHAVRFEAFAREAEHGELVRFDAHQQVVSAVEAERDALQKRADALAVENENQRDWINKCSELWDAGCDLDNLLGLIPETPATDAALAAIRNEATARALKHLCDCQLISATVAELKADELREAK
ncbi:hypothetical protein I5N20_10365 [Serratia marcescens]|nr:hypothetical protein [Serratia marcescens]